MYDIVVVLCREKRFCRAAENCLKTETEIIFMTTIDLSGAWDVYLDETKSTQIPQTYPDSIVLPDSTSNAGLFRENKQHEYGFLTDAHKFEGFAWFRRTVEIPDGMQDKQLSLFLERTRMSAVYIDGREYGCGNSLCAPHRFSLGGLSAGRHELVVRIANTGYPTGGGHMTSPDTQSNWNGIVGRIELQYCEAYPEAVYVVPDITAHTLSVRAEICGRQQGSVQLRVFDERREYAAAQTDYENGTLEYTIGLPSNVPLWDEFSPNLLKLQLSIGCDSRTVTVGMREMRGDGQKLLINGREAFLRGKHDGMVFPKTGYAPADVKSWLDVFHTAKEYGINHYRFHTCCPPEAAFEAADIMGIYMQPELPFWGTIPDEFGAEHEYLRDEGFRILREFSHHPSFVMMSMGNELWGSKERLNELIAGYRAVCPDKMYVGGSNNYQFVPCVLDEDDFFSGVRLGHDRLIRGSYAMCDAPQGHIQTDEPNSLHCYDPIINEKNALESVGGEIMIQYGTEMKTVSAEEADEFVPDVPVISHEVGQYAMYPDFDEIAEYKGALRHTPYEAYMADLEKNHLAQMWREFFKASGRLAVQCYRDEIETAMRSAQLSGFQLLDIQDFPGQGVATVGILNAFLENKGHITAAQWRSFCSDTVVLAVLGKYVCASGEEIVSGIQLSSTRPDFDCQCVSWSVEAAGKAIAGGKSALHSRRGRISLYKSISFAVDTEKPCKAVLKLWIDGTDISNSYTLYVFPQLDVKITEAAIEYGGRRVEITHDPAAAANPYTLYVPLPDENSLAGEYCTDFWCYGMFRSISESMGKPVPTGTLGLYIDKNSPLLSGFETDSHTTPPWYAIVSHSHCADLDGTEISPDVWVIDNPQRHKRLALLYRDNGTVCCTSRLWEIADRAEVKCFAASIVDYFYGGK